MERTKHGLYVFPPKKTLIWRRHCSIDQSCCSMTSKQFLESSSGMKFVYPSVRLANQNPGAFVSVRYTNQIALFPFVYCFCFVRAFSFQGHTKIALYMYLIDSAIHRIKIHPVDNVIGFPNTYPRDSDLSQWWIALSGCLNYWGLQIDGGLGIVGYKVLPPLVQHL